MAKKTSGDDWTQGFETASAEVKPRIVGVSFGEPGSGKSAFWFSAPGPIAYFGFDLGAEGVIEDFQTHKDIHTKMFSWLPDVDASSDDLQKQAQEIRDEFTTYYERAIQHARTVIIDRGTDLWEIIRYAEWGAPTGAQKDYYGPNLRMRKIFALAKMCDVNLGVIDSMKDRWVTKTKNDGSGKSQGQNTGTRMRNGWDDNESQAHTVLSHESTADGFLYTVKKAHGPGAGDVQEQSFLVARDNEEKLNAFVELGLRLYPTSSESDWR